MKLRKRYLPLVALLGAALAVIPAMANTTGPSTATVSGLESRMWSPMEVAITLGGTVTFQNTSSNVPHGIVWTSVPETPVCSGVPIGKGEYNWKGTCTFSKEGTYTYYCYVHGMSMSGKVYVNPDGTVPTGTTPTGTTTTPTMTMTTPTTTVPTTTSTTPSTPSTTPTTTGTAPTQTTGTTPAATSASSLETGAGRPGAGGGANPVGSSAPHDSLQGGSLHMAASQNSTVHGSIQVVQAGSRLEIDLLASSASIATAARSGSVLVGRFVEVKVPAGRVSFKVTPTGRAKHALARHGHLVLRVRIALTPPHGAKLTRTLTVTLR
jgi:plastocyanin